VRRPEEADEPARRKARSSLRFVGHGWSLPVLLAPSVRVRRTPSP
jgi:hypothetical protein